MENIMNEKDTVLEVRDLELWFNGDYGAVKILNKVSFDINKGETLGIVGESGCGKSMTSLCIMQLLNTPPAVINGSIKLRGRELLALSDKQMQQIRGNKISMIFQEPMTSLNPVFTIGYQIVESLMLHKGMDKKTAYARAIELLELVGIPEAGKRVDEYPHQLSGGMRQRVMIAMALAGDPELLIADEPTTALDVTIQAQILDLLKSLQKKLNMSIIIITHDLGVIAEMADEVAVMYAGDIVEKAKTKELFADPKHPYTIGLMNSIPDIDDEHERLNTLEGLVPSLYEMPKGCRFAPRCQFACAECEQNRIHLTDLENGRQVRCRRYENV